MPALTNARQENLAQLLATGQLSKVKACQEAGYKVKDHDTSTASRYSNHPDVQARKQELIAERHRAERMATERAIEQETVTKAYLVRHLKYLGESSLRGTKEIFDAQGNHAGWRRTAGDGNVAHSAFRTLAQMGGFLIEKVEHGQPGDFERLNDDELRMKLIETGESIGIDPKLLQKAIEGKIE
jgi:hypothetical protein